MSAAAAIAQALERELASPETLTTALVDPDDHDELPTALCAALDRGDLSSYYVPLELGGRLTSFEEFAAIIGAIAKRDAGLAISHAKTYLGASTVWIGGSHSLRKRVAALVRGGGRISLGLTELDHGADLLATETHAVLGGDVYALSGGKWLINNATRGDAIVVLARTGGTAGPRALTLFYVDKRAVDPATWRTLPRVLTHGMRGVEISGIAFDGTRVPAHCVVGEPGLGLELTLRAFQITRTVIAALSLGVTDTVLRRAVALTRPARGNSFEPYAAAVLAGAYADLWMASCAVTAGARALHVVPQQMSLVSVVTKAGVPELLNRTIGALAELTGAHRAMRLHVDDARMHKAIRDAGIMEVFDGSTAVSLHTVSVQLANRRARTDDAGIVSSLRGITERQQPLPPFQAARLTLTSRARNDIVDGLPLILRMDSQPPTGSAGRVIGAAGRLDTVLAELQSRGAASARERFDRTPEALDFAWRYVRIHLAAAAFHMWRAAPEIHPRLDDLATLALTRVEDDLAGARTFPPARVAQALCAELARRCEQGLSLLPPPFDEDHG